MQCIKVCLSSSGSVRWYPGLQFSSFQVAVVLIIFSVAKAQSFIKSSTEHLVH